MMNHNWNTEDIIEHFTLLPAQGKREGQESGAAKKHP
jgi:hypothetical protein